MHQTLRAFDYPNSQLIATNHWSVLLRPRQVTLGSLVLVVQDDLRSLGALPKAVAQELPTVVASVEAALRSTFGAEKFNYLCLMMVDPQVHFHIIPRYSRSVRFYDNDYHDNFWPGPPDVTTAMDNGSTPIAQLKETLGSAIAREFDLTKI
ncbi:MAG: HIT family protein [Paracoccaceae bacterium]